MRRLSVIVSRFLELSATPVLWLSSPPATFPQDDTLCGIRPRLRANHAAWTGRRTHFNTPCSIFMYSLESQCHWQGGQRKAIKLFQVYYLTTWQWLR